MVLNNIAHSPSSPSGNPPYTFTLLLSMQIVQDRYCYKVTMVHMVHGKERFLHLVHNKTAHSPSSTSGNPPYFHYILCRVSLTRHPQSSNHG